MYYMCSNAVIWLCTVVFVLCVCPFAGAQPSALECSIADRIDGDVEVYHIASYGGTSELGAAIEIDDSGHDVKKIDVLLNRPNKRVVLVMTAYDPIVWNVAWTTGTQIKGVVVSGYHGQAVLGIPKSVPIYLKTALGKKTIISASEKCPYVCVHGREGDCSSTGKELDRIIGKQVTQFMQAPSKGIVMVGTPIHPSSASLEFSRDYRLDDFVVRRKPGEVPAGHWGLEELVKKGVIRHASPADIRSFEASGVKGIVHGMSTYVVLKKTKMPDGLYGGHSVNILVPAGVPMPGGPRGHNFFFRFGQSKCAGPGCE